MSPAAGGAPRSPASRVRALVALAFLFLVLIGLGIWQVERRAWKLDLIARVDARIHAAPVPAPGPREWPALTPKRDEYRRVSARGTFLNDRETLVQAVTEQGAGFWVVTPLKTPGFTLLVNRGFVPEDRRDPASRRAGEVDGPVTVVGLLRVTEPGGAFLRSNDPVHGHWYSRDVAAIARARGLGTVAPYFIDADARPNPGGLPIGGLTVVNFPNNHLVYALTWFGLAALALCGMVTIGRRVPDIEG